MAATITPLDKPISELAALLGLKYRINHIPKWKIPGIQKAPNRPGTLRPGQPRKSTVHGTANFNAGATAAMHEAFVRGPSWGTVTHADGSKDITSYQWVSDDIEVVELLPWEEIAYHGGTYESNTWWLSHEICENNGHYGAATLDIAARLQACIAVKAGHDSTADWMVQHNAAYGKDCPYLMRHTAGAWDAFVGEVNRYIGVLLALVKPVDPNNPNSVVVNGFTVQGGFYDLWKKYGIVIMGLPLSAEYMELEEIPGRGKILVTYQDFENVVVQWYAGIEPRICAGIRKYKYDKP